MATGAAVVILWTVVVLVAIYLWVQLRKFLRIRSLVNRIPGPQFHRFGAAYELLGIPREERFPYMLKKFEDSNKHGISHVWMGPVPVVMLLKPSYVETLLSSQVHLTKSFYYNFFRAWLGMGLLTSYGAKWHRRRKLLTPAFHFRILDEFLPVFNEQSQILVKKLESKEDCNLLRFITLCTLDVICVTAMGSDAATQLNEDSKYAFAVTEAIRLLYNRCQSPWYYPNFLFNASSKGKEYHRHVETLKSFTRQVINKKREEIRRRKEVKGKEIDESVFGRKQKLAFLDLLLKYSQDGQVLSDDDIQEEVDTFMFEGHDTTTSAIFWTLYLLGVNKHIQDKVHEELDSIFSNTQRPVLLDDLANMKYLENVCKEALRIVPPVPMIGRYLKEDLKVGDYIVPAGIQVLVMPLLVHRLEDQYPDPMKFDPDRHILENCQGRHPYAYIPFSAGPRNCIGQKFAMMEEKVVLANILRRFEVIAELPENGELPIIPEIVTKPNSKCKISIKARS